MSSTPRSEMLPASGTSNPAIIRSSGVFLEPDGPSLVKNSPRPIVRSASRTAAWVPKRWVRPRSTTGGSVVAIGVSQGVYCDIPPRPHATGAKTAPRR